MFRTKIIILHLPSKNKKNSLFSTFANPFRMGILPRKKGDSEWVLEKCDIYIEKMVLQPRLLSMRK
jgi:hypothetical protein